jgi:hypothetical protein
MMTRKWRLFVIGALLFFLAIYVALVAFRVMPPDALLGFLGVLVGALVVEASRASTAELQRLHELRVASIDRRLQVYQQAYSLWRKLIFAPKDRDKVMEIVIRCEDWWDDNCLYLDEPSRDAFLKAVHAAADHIAFFLAHEDSTILHQTWKDVLGAGPILVQAAALPSLQDRESTRTGRVQTLSDA